MHSSFDTTTLASRVQARRGSRPLRQIAEEIGVSLSTLSRVENGHMPDMHTFLALCDWLEASPMQFIHDAPATTLTDLDAVEHIGLALHAAPFLSEDLVTALMTLMRLFHDRHTRQH